MKIKPINNINKRSTQSFNARISKELKFDLESIGEAIRNFNGKSSKEYQDFQSKMRTFEVLCPKDKLVMLIDDNAYGDIFYSYALKRPFKKPNILLSGTSYIDDMYSMEKLNLLEKRIIEEDIKQLQLKENKKNDKKTNIIKKLLINFLK